MSQRFDDAELRLAYAPMRHESTLVHGPECPSEDALLSALRGESPEHERLRTLDHALQCAACRRELALLHSVSGLGARAGSVLRRGLTWRRVIPLALAASLLLAVGVAGVSRWQRSGGDVTRAGGSTTPTLVRPSNGSTVAAGRVRFVWRSVAGALGYTLEVDATDGTVLFTARTADTALTAPLTGTATGEYRWSVAARMDD